MPPSSPSLLLRIQDPADQTAWNSLIEVYSAILVRFARSQGMRHDDAEDIAVSVLEDWRKEIANWDFGSGISAIQKWLRKAVLEQTEKFDRVRRQRRQMGDVPRLPQQQRFSPQAAFQWLWVQEHIWACRLRVKQPADDPWEFAKQVDEEMDRLTELGPDAKTNRKLPLGERRRQIEQAGPYPAKRAVDPYADPLPTGWIPGLVTLAEIGRGAQGVAYLAVHEQDGSKVMVKVFHGEYAGDEERRNQIEIAVQHAQTLHHPHLVPIYGLGHCQNGQLYVALKHLAGCTLQQALNGGYPGMPNPTEQQRLTWMRQASEAVTHAHQHGLLHLGLHDRNIVIDDHKEARVVDFGLPASEPRRGSSDALTDLIALGKLLENCFEADSPQKEQGALTGTQRAGLRAILLQCQSARHGSMYRGVDALYRDLVALEQGHEVRARRNDRLYRLQRFARQRIGTAAVLAAVMAYAFYSHQVAAGGHRAKLNAAEQVADVRAIVNQVFDGLHGEAVRSLQPESSHRQLRDLAQRYLQWLQQSTIKDDGLRLDIAGMLMLIAEAQIQTTDARQPDSPSALLTLGELHEVVPSDVDVSDGWTAAADRAVDLRTRAWLLADEIYRRRQAADDFGRRLQTLEHARELSQVERRHWFEQPSSQLRRLRVELAWMRYHLDGQLWPQARTNQHHLLLLVQSWQRLRLGSAAESSGTVDAEIPLWLGTGLTEVTLEAAQTMLQHGQPDSAWPLLWKQVDIDKALGRMPDERIQSLLHQMSMLRQGEPVENGPNWPLSWLWLHQAMAIGAGVSNGNSGT